MLAVGELRDGRVQQGNAILIGLSKEFPQNALYLRQIARLNCPLQLSSGSLTEILHSNRHNVYL